MLINFDLDKINHTLQDFYNSTGINIQLVKDDFSVIFTAQKIHNSFCRTIQNCPAGHNACSKSDRILLKKCKESKKPEMHICHAGLVDLAVPIIYSDEILCYIILGQLKKHDDFSSVEKNLDSLDIEIQHLKKCYAELPVYDFDRIQSVSNIAVMLTKYILLENMLKPTRNRTLEDVTEFIDANLSTPLTVQFLSKNVNISKSALYTLFRKTFDCTVSEYINRKRVEKSLEYLKTSDMSIEEISQAVGFSSGAYFTLNFKKINGIPPLKYRKML